MIETHVEGERQALRAQYERVTAEYLTQYRDAGVGEVPIEVYERVRAACGPLGDDFKAMSMCAEVELEMAIAMHRQRTSEAEPLFKPKEVNGMFDSALSRVRLFCRDEDPGIRAHFLFLAEALRLYREVTVTPPPWKKGNLQGYLRSMYPLVIVEGNQLQHEADPKRDRDVYILALMGVMGEARPKDRFLPALSRQGWQVSAFDADRPADPHRLIIGDEEVEGCVTIPPSFLGADGWPEVLTSGIPSYSRHHTALIMYGAYDPNFMQSKKPVGDMSIFGHAGIVENFGRIAKGVWARIETKEAAAPDSETKEAEPVGLAPEVQYYLDQPSGSLLPRQEANIAERLEQLEQRAGQGAEQGELSPYEQYLVGWMRLESARLASREVHADMDPKKLAAINAQWEAVEATFLRAAEQLASNNQPGHACLAVFAAESVQLYWAMSYKCDAQAIKEYTHSYHLRFPQILAQIKTALTERGCSSEEQALLEECLRLGASCLQIGDAADEAQRHIAVLAPPRSGGEQGKQDLAVFFPADYLWQEIGGEVRELYDSPVWVKLVAGGQTSASNGFVKFGEELIAQPGRMQRAFMELTNTITGRKKSKPRPEALNVRTNQIADAIFDAS